MVEKSADMLAVGMVGQSVAWTVDWMVGLLVDWMAE